MPSRRLSVNHIQKHSSMKNIVLFMKDSYGNKPLRDSKESIITTGAQRGIQKDQNSRATTVFDRCSAESEQALEDSYRSLEQILTGYILEINEVDAENIRDTEAMNKRLAGMPTCLSCLNCHR